MTNAQANELPNHLDASEDAFADAKIERQKRDAETRRMGAGLASGVPFPRPAQGKPAEPQHVTLHLGAIERSQHNGLSIWKLFVGSAGFMPFWFTIDDPVIVAAITTLSDADQVALELPQRRINMKWMVESYKDGKYSKAVKVTDDNPQPAETVIAETLTRTSDYALTLTDGRVLHFPLTDIEISRKPFDKPEREALNGGKPVHIQWQIRYQGQVVTDIKLMIDGHVFQSEREKKESPPMVDKPKSNLAPAMAAFNAQCKGKVPDDTALRDRIRHEATGGASWKDITDFSGPLMATKALIDNGAWKRWPEGDPDGSRAEFAALTADREKEATAPVSTSATVNDSAEREQAAPAPNLTAKPTIQGETRVYNYQPLAVWPTDRGCTIYQGVRFSVTLYAPDATWDDAVRLMEQFTANPDSIPAACRVSVDNTQPAAPRPSAPPMASSGQPPKLPETQTADSKIETETGYALTRNNNDGKPGYTISYMAGGTESKYPLKITAPQAIKLLEETLVNEGYAVDQFVVGQRYPLSVRARWTKGKEYQAATATTPAKHYRDYKSFDVIRETVPTNEIPF